MQIKNPSRYALGNMEDLMQSKRMKAVIAVLMLGFAGLLVGLFSINVLTELSLALLDVYEAIVECFWVDGRPEWPSWSAVVYAFEKIVNCLDYMLPTIIIFAMLTLSFGFFSAFSCFGMKKNLGLQTKTFVVCAITAAVLCLFPGTAALTVQILLIFLFVVRYVFCLNRREVNPNVGFKFLRSASIFLFVATPIFSLFSEYILDFALTGSVEASVDLGALFDVRSWGDSLKVLFQYSGAKLAFVPAVLGLMLIAALCFYLSCVMEGKAEITGWTRFSFGALIGLLFFEYICLNVGAVAALTLATEPVVASGALVGMAIFLSAWQIAMVLIATILISMRPKKV